MLDITDNMTVHSGNLKVNEWRIYFRELRDNGNKQLHPSGIKNPSVAAAAYRIAKLQSPFASDPVLDDHVFQNMAWQSDLFLS